MWTRETMRLRRQTAQAFVAHLRSTTPCRRCKKRGRVEWHRREHEQKPWWRIGALVQRGASATVIRAEMNRSTPLCRRCHQILDGRLDALPTLSPRQRGSTLPKQPCITCGRACGGKDDGRTRGKCRRCYCHDYYLEHRQLKRNGRGRPPLYA